MFCSNSFTRSNGQTVPSKDNKGTCPCSHACCPFWYKSCSNLQQPPFQTKGCISQHYANLAVEHTTIPSFPFLQLNTTSFFLHLSFTVFTVRQLWLTSLICSQGMRTEYQAHRCSTDDLHMMEVGEITRVRVTSQFQTLQAQW